MEEQRNARDIGDFTNISYIGPESGVFEKTDGGFTSFTDAEGKRYERINLHRAFPFTEERRFISLRDQEGKEIGIIEDLYSFKDAIRDILLSELERRYFSPVVTRVIDVKEEFGYFYFDCDTESGRKRFTVQGSHNSLIQITETRLLLVDVDGNRYEVPDFRELDSKGRRAVESLM